MLVQPFDKWSDLVPSDEIGFILIKFKPDVIDALFTSFSSFFEIISQFLVQETEILPQT